MTNKDMIKLSRLNGYHSKSASDIMPDVRELNNIIKTMFFVCPPAARGLNAIATYGIQNSGTSSEGDEYKYYDVDMQEFINEHDDLYPFYREYIDTAYEVLNNPDIEQIEMIDRKTAERLIKLNNKLAELEI